MFNGPSSPPNTRPQSARWHAYVGCPLEKGLAFTIVRDYYVGPAIASLRKARSPIAIVRSVALAIVSTLKRKTFAPIAEHIGDEVFYRVPSVAYLDSPASVPIIGGVVSIMAPGQHIEPSRVQPMTTKTMSSLSLARKFCMQTAAGLRRAPHEIGPRNIANISAIASTGDEPRATARFCGGSADDGPAPKSALWLNVFHAASIMVDWRIATGSRSFAC